MALNRAKAIMEADRLVRQGKLLEAIRQYNSLADDNPRDVNTINRIGDLYVRLGKTKEAIKQFLRIADFYAGDGFHLKAIAMYKKIAKLDPAHFDAYERLAELYGKQGLITEARTQYLSLADQCLKARRTKKAIEIYGKILELEPGNLKARLVHAELEGREGNLDQAVAGFLAVAADLRKRGHNEEALKVLQKASKLQPANAELLTRTAEILQPAGKNPEEALASLRRLLEEDPGNLDYVKRLTEAYLGLGREAEAENLVGTLGSAETRAAAVEAQVQFYLSRGEQEAGISRLLTAAKKAAAEPDPPRAARWLERILELEPTRVEVLEKLVEVWTLAADRPALISVSERLAQCLVAEEEWDRALPVVERLQDLDPENAVAKELRSRVESAVGITSTSSSDDERDVPSLEDLEKVVDLQPELAEEAEALEAAEMEMGEAASDHDFEPEAPEALEVGEEDFEAQDAAYASKSVIQEMRGEPAVEPVDEEFLSEHFTEAEVFLKYGLVEKAKEQLQTILNRYSFHLPSWMKFREIYLEEGKQAQAAAACLEIAALHRKNGDDLKADEFEKEARDLGVTPVPGPPPSTPEAPAPGGREEGPAAPVVLPPLLSEDLDLELPEPAEAESRVTRKGEAPTSRDASIRSGGEEELTIEIAEEGAEEGAGSGFDEEKIGEVDFFIEQGLLEEAEEILQGLSRAAPGHPEIQKRLRRVAELNPAPAPAAPAAASGNLDMDVERAFGKVPPAPHPSPSPPAAPPPDDGFFDLASELQAQLAQPASEDGSEPASDVAAREEESLDEIFKAFRKKVDQQVEEGDYETRYNLGIAYKEMGLLDEAIGEFQYASREPALFLECCSILGICFREKGMSELAVKWYRKALESTGYSEEKYQGLRYDLGELHLERGEYSQALALFSEVYGFNSNYRDVSSKIRELKKRVG